MIAQLICFLPPPTLFLLVVVGSIFLFLSEAFDAAKHSTQTKRNVTDSEGAKNTSKVNRKLCVV